MKSKNKQLTPLKISSIIFGVYCLSNYLIIKLAVFCFIHRITTGHFVTNSTPEFIRASSQFTMPLLIAGVFASILVLLKETHFRAGLLISANIIAIYLPIYRTQKIYGYFANGFSDGTFYGTFKLYFSDNPILFLFDFFGVLMLVICALLSLYGINKLAKQTIPDQELTPSVETKVQSNPYITAGKITGALICSVCSVFLSTFAYPAGIPWVPGGDSWGWGHLAAAAAGFGGGLIVTIIITPILFAIRSLPLELKYVGTLFTAPIVLFIFAVTSSSISKHNEQKKFDEYNHRLQTMIANPLALKDLIEKTKTQALSPDESRILAGAMSKSNSVVQEEMPVLLKHYDLNKWENGIVVRSIISNQKLTDDQFRLIYASTLVLGDPEGMTTAMTENPDTPTDILQDLLKRNPDTFYRGSMANIITNTLKQRNAALEASVDWSVKYSPLIAEVKALVPPPPPPDHMNVVHDAKDKCLDKFRAQPELVTDNDFWKQQVNDPDQIAYGALLWLLEDPNFTITKKIKDYVIANFPNYFPQLRDRHLLTRGAIESVIQNSCR